MTIPLVDCQGLAGAWTLGAVQTGKFNLKHRVSLKGGFGDDVIHANRHLVGDDWEQETPPDAEWTPQHGVGFLCGTPPCSGFSLLNRSKKENARGPDSNINLCMKELIQYAAKCTGTDGQLGPEVISFESVQGAYSQGRVLMQKFLDILHAETGQPYMLHHVLMSGSSVGAAQMRHRYYPVFARIPFGVDTPEERQVVTYDDSIGDLQGLEMTWDDQPYPNVMPAEWALRKRRPDGFVDAHVTMDHGKMVDLIQEVVDAGWLPGENLVAACIRTGLRPKSIEKSYNAEKNDYKGWNWPCRIKPNRPGYVLTGGGIFGFVHWSEPRLLSVRECSRLMGYTDEWTWSVTDRPNVASMWIGKCCPVDSGRWISNWVARAIEGTPGGMGERIGDAEVKYNFTLLYKKWPGGNVPPRPVLPGAEVQSV